MAEERDAEAERRKKDVQARAREGEMRAEERQGKDASGRERPELKSRPVPDLRPRVEPGGETTDKAEDRNSVRRSERSDRDNYGRKHSREGRRGGDEDHYGGRGGDRDHPRDGGGGLDGYYRRDGGGRRAGDSRGRFGKGGGDRDRTPDRTYYNRRGDSGRDGGGDRSTFPSNFDAPPDGRGGDAKRRRLGSR